MTTMTQPLLPGMAAAAPKKTRRTPKAAVPVTSTPAYTTGVDEAGQRQWTLTFPAPAKLLSANGRLHWRAVAPVNKTWREAMFVHAKAAKLPTGLGRVLINIELRFPTGGRRDSANYYTAMKPVVDALGPQRVQVVKRGKRAGQTVVEVGDGLIVDDTPEFLAGPFIRLGASGKRLGAPFGEVVVVITELVVAG